MPKVYFQARLPDWITGATDTSHSPETSMPIMTPARSMSLREKMQRRSVSSKAETRQALAVEVAVCVENLMIHFEVAVGVNRHAEHHMLL